MSPQALSAIPIRTTIASFDWSAWAHEPGECTQIEKLVALLRNPQCRTHIQPQGELELRRSSDQTCPECSNVQQLKTGINMYQYVSFIVEGSLEVKLPTIWTDEKQSRAEAERRERLEERRVEEKGSKERRCRCAKR